MNTWHIMFPDGRLVGPVDTEQFRRESAAGHVPPGTTACLVGQTQWMPVVNIPELSAPPAAAPGGGVGQVEQRQVVPEQPQWLPNPQGQPTPGAAPRTPSSPSRRLPLAVVFGALGALLVVGAVVAAVILMPSAASGTFCARELGFKDPNAMGCWEVNLEQSTARWSVTAKSGGYEHPHVQLVRESRDKYSYENFRGIPGEMIFIDKNTITEKLGRDTPAKYTRRGGR